MRKKTQTVEHRVFTNTKNIASISKKLSKMDKDVSSIRDTIDNIEVNGRRGLNESLQDIYRKIDDIIAKDSQRFWNRPMKENLGINTVFGRMMWFLIFYFALAAILHPLGIEIPFSDIVKIVFTRPVPIP